MIQYDYAILGTGLSGLLMAYRMANDSYFSDKKILLLDQSIKNTNDRTWCFWQEGKSEFENLISKYWYKAYIGNATFEDTFLLSPYKYNLIRSKDFYEYVINFISSKDNFFKIYDTITGVEEKDTHIFIVGKQNNYTSLFLLNSIFKNDAILKQTKYPYLKQHFVGWFIKVESPIFIADEVKFMDFTIQQKNNTRFMYILPLNANIALFEYTLFSEHLLPFEEYENEIKNYLKEKGIENYEIIEKEQGNIPMTCFPLYNKNTKRQLFIGTAGGWTKASTGYTFYSSLKKSEKLVSFLKKEKPLNLFEIKNRYWWYDLIFLEVLHKNNEKGGHLFGLLFKKNNIKDIFIFLNEEGSFLSDFKIMLSLPKILFIKAAIRSIKKIIIN